MTIGRRSVSLLVLVAGLAVLLSLALPVLQAGSPAAGPSLWVDVVFRAGVLAYLAGSLIRRRPAGEGGRALDALALAILAYAGGAALLGALDAGTPGMGFWLMVLAFWLVAWRLADRLSSLDLRNPLAARLVNLAVPVVFGITALMIWEIVVRGLDVPRILLPAPSTIAVKFGQSLPTLWADFVQTYLKAVIAGYLLGCGSGFVVAILIDRSPFLKRGLMPIGNLVSALPIVGVAPVMVMWFGFDWPSKAAVVVIMTFFPMLVNTIAGLSAAGAMERDLMHTYAAGYWPSLFKLRLPAAMPFIFNALKINSTLALIGAIVAEFFGTPIVGMGFRISVEIGRMNTDMVWAEIAVAALAGSISYGLLSVVERVSTFWHPSYRKG